jgi:hypothetical protein
VTVLTEPTTDESRDTGHGLIHAYPADPWYRLSGCAVPQVGDVARCGWVKCHPPVGGNLPLSCVVCAEMRRQAQGL